MRKKKTISKLQSEEKNQQVENKREVLIPKNQIWVDIEEKKP